MAIQNYSGAVPDPRGRKPAAQRSMEQPGRTSSDPKMQTLAEGNQSALAYSLLEEGAQSANTKGRKDDLGGVSARDDTLH